MLKIWNVWLVSITYMLTVLGTFLTRSGIVQSVHAFASTDVGWVFMLYLGITLVSVMWLTIYRMKELESERKIESFFSRESAFLLNNLVFLGICFATLWGVLFPVLSEAITGEKQTVGIPFFNAVNVPLFLFMVFLMGVGPLIAWRKATLQSLLKAFLVPAITSLVLGSILLWAGIRGFYPILSYCLCWFVVMTIMAEFHRGVRAQKVSATGESEGYVSGAQRLLRRHRDRYAGYLVHFGVVMVVVAITASMSHRVEKEFTLAKGESLEVERFKLTLDSLGEKENPNYSSVYGVVRATDRISGELIATLTPELRRYAKNGETTTEVQLHVSPKDDLYLVFIGIEPGERVSMKLFINPLQVWLWIGSLVMTLGTIILILPNAKRVVQHDATMSHAVARD